MPQCLDTSIGVFIGVLHPCLNASPCLVQCHVQRSGQAVLVDRAGTGWAIAYCMCYAVLGGSISTRHVPNEQHNASCTIHHHTSHRRRPQRTSLEFNDTPHYCTWLVTRTIAAPWYIWCLAEALFLQGGEFFNYIANKGVLRNEEAQFYGANVLLAIEVHCSPA